MNAKFNPRVTSDPSWLHWALTVPLLAGHLAGVPWCLLAAVSLCGLMTLLMWTKVHSIQAMPVQVRLAYLALLLLGSLPYMQWLHWVQLVGTSAMVLFGYCPLVRMLTLLPWNRSEVLSRPFLSRLIFASAPGGLWQWPTVSSPVAACCSCSVVATNSCAPAGDPASPAWTPSCSLE